MTNETIVPVSHRRKLRLALIMSPVLILQMVKLSIVLTPQFLSHDQDQLTKELQQHVKSGTCPCEYLRKVIHSLHDHFHPGTDFCGIPWIVVIIVFLGISTLAIFLWKTNLCVSFLKTVLKSRNVHDRSTDVHRRAWRSNSRSQEGIKIGMEDLYTSPRYMEAKVQTEVHKVTTKVNSHYKISGQRKTPKEEIRKLRMKECEQAEKDRQLSEAEENGKSIMKEIDTDMKLFHAAERLWRRAEDYYRRKIAPSARKPHANWVRMAAVEHYHSSGLPYWPDLTAETLRKRKGRQAPPPTQCHLGVDDSLSLKTPPECLLVPLPPSPVGDFLTPEKPHVECCWGPVPSPRGDSVRKLKTSPDSFFVPLPPSPVDDSLSLKTPPECLLVPLPPSPVDDFLTPEKPPVECCRGPVPSPRGDNVRKRKTPPDSFFVPLPPSPVDDFQTTETPPIKRRQGPVPSPLADNVRKRKTPPDTFFVPLPPSPVDDSLSLKTPPECLLVPLPPSPVDDFLTPEKPHVECCRGPVPSPRGDNVSKRKTPPDSFFVPLPPSPVDDSLSLKTPPECLLVPLPPSPVDDFLTPEKPHVECCRGPVPSPRADNVRKRKTPPDSFFVPLPPSPVDDSLSLKTPPECLLVPLPPSPVDNLKTPPECLLVPLPPSLPPSPVDDSLSLKTPPECLLVPLPPSPVDDFLTPEKPHVECCRGPVPSPRADNVRKRKTPPDSFFVPLPPSPVDDSLSLKTPPECLLVPLPPSPVDDDFLTPEKPPVECSRGPVPSPRADNVRKRKTPPDSSFCTSSTFSSG
ncbi:nuclear pore complex-interacting protein family member B4-like [Symphalangus syndactylus]|uniref:nuclear pore complex-interacting protein family member B4-like n=1 Tax=Symphalangus syndactylus TaxID=9590 RepID=UPI0030042C5A